MNNQSRTQQGRTSDGLSDRRWVVLTESGALAGTLGRARDPDEADIRRAEDAMAAQGAAGWLAILSGSPYNPDVPTLLEVRPLNNPVRQFAEAAAALRSSMMAERGG
jgi:hypothetical protein